MTYQRFRLAELEWVPATVATVATEPRAGPQSVANVASVAAPDPNMAFEERVAIVEYDAGASREWAEGFARLDVSRPIPGFSEERWHELLNDGGRFLDRWATRAAELGWSAEDVFGVSNDSADGGQPVGGLVFLIQGGDVVDVRADRATIRMLDECCVTYLRSASSERATLWELAMREWATFF